VTADNSGKPSGETPRDEGEQEPVVVRDRRRIDPKTGQRRTPPANGGESVGERMSGTLDEELAQAAGEEEASVAAAAPAGADAEAAKQIEVEACAKASRP
jgi:molecular chaperone GrpE